MPRNSPRHLLPVTLFASLMACGPSSTSDAPIGRANAASSWPATTEMLGAAVFDALVQRDQAAFAALILPDGLALSACPEGAERAGKDTFLATLAKSREAAFKAFASCSAREGWREARDLRVGPSSRLEVQKCGGLSAWRSIEAQSSSTNRTSRSA
ncbi:MAG TPA: hypothetical protein PK095_01540 [Myxococcota bacterium]|nr:hypothetical protein [Myxococcota bacterium]